MFADPQSVTINAVPITLPRTPRGTSYGVFTKDDGLVQLLINHNVVGKKTRRVVELRHAKIASDPLLAGVNVKAGFRTYLVMESQETGYSLTEQKQVVDGLTAFLTASSGANVTKILGGES